MSLELFKSEETLTLESGEALSSPEIAYHTYGNYLPGSSKVIWVCHALTANSDVFDWWDGLFGKDKLFDPNEYFIVCDNIIGSCYGSTGPLSINPETGEAYYHSFPQVTIRDMVSAHELLRTHLGIRHIDLVIGSSVGAMQALEWNIAKPELFDRLVFIAGSAKHSAWGVAFNESQRMAIETDCTWKTDSPDAGLQGMKTARSMALLSYRHYYTYAKTQTETNNEITDNYKASSYQQYQGAKLAKRFDAFSYYWLSKSMDSHNVARNRGSIAEALDKIKAKTLCIGISSDVLFPTEEQEFVAKHIKGATYREIDSLYGHDGFLIETEKLETVLCKFLASTVSEKVAC